MYRGWTQTDYQNKHYNINKNDEGTQDDRGRDGGTNFILRIKEQEKRLTLQEHDDDYSSTHFSAVISAGKLKSVKSAEITAIWCSVTVMYYTVVCCN